MSKKISKIARSTRVDALVKTLKKNIPNSSVDQNTKVATGIESKAYEILSESNNINCYHQSLADHLFQHLSKSAEFKQEYLPTPEFVNPLHTSENDPKLKHLLPLTKEELNFVFPIETSKISQDKIAHILGIPASSLKTMMHCSKCKAPAVIESIKQMRSADEGFTVQFNCTKCPHSWKTSN